MELISHRRSAVRGGVTALLALVMGLCGAWVGGLGPPGFVVGRWWSAGWSGGPTGGWAGGVVAAAAGAEPWAAAATLRAAEPPGAVRGETGLAFSPGDVAALAAEPWSSALGSAPTLARPPTTPARQGRLSWPLSPVPVVAKYFDAPETPYGAGHRGVDLAAVPGQDVLAADAGVVVFAGLVAGRPVLSVDHDGGLRTTYEPVAAKVAVGDQVYRGQVLGTVLAGHPGCAIAACLHWGVRRGDEYVDPLALTGEVGEYRLKPWGGGP